MSKSFSYHFQTPSLHFLTVIPLDDEGPRFMLRRFSRPLSRSQASTLDWNARLND
jgi:hypothetical protein